MLSNLLWLESQPYRGENHLSLASTPLVDFQIRTENKAAHLWSHTTTGRSEREGLRMLLARPPRPTALQCSQPCARYLRWEHLGKPHFATCSGGCQAPQEAKTFNHLSPSWMLSSTVSTVPLFLSTLHSPPVPGTVPHCPLEFTLSSSQNFPFASFSKWTESPLRKLLALHPALSSDSCRALQDLQHQACRQGRCPSGFILPPSQHKNDNNKNPHPWMSYH